MMRKLAPLALVLALAAALPRILPVAVPRFMLPTASLAPSPAPYFSEHLLPNPQPSAHAATLAELADGRLAAAWFAGSKEGARDVTIDFSTFNGKTWTAPRTIVSRRQTQDATGRLVRKLGNPVLATDAAGRLHLWFVAVGYGGWAGAAINHTVSNDGGQNWNTAQRLITSPFWNFSTLVRTPPLPLADGGFGMPAYHEFVTKRAEWLRLTADGHVLDKARLPGAARTLQPAVAALDATRALAMMRDASSTNRIPLTSSDDAGYHWHATRTTDLPNPNASVALLRLADGRLLLAWNPQTENRNKLALSVSINDGKNWSPPRLVENATGGEEFSYPALLQSRDGAVHLAYTWQRKTIKHLAFSPAWLDETAPSRPMPSPPPVGAGSREAALREPTP